MQLGRYHARSLELMQLNRRLQEAATNLTAAGKEMKKLSEARPEDADDDSSWHQRVGAQHMKLRKLKSEKESAQAAVAAFVNGKTAPLFSAPGPEVARDLIAAGLTLMFAQELERDEVARRVGYEYEAAALRAAFAKSGAEKIDHEQIEMFADEMDRATRERALAYIMATTHVRPKRFTWLEIVAHFTDAELEAAWGWAAAPHLVDEPDCITRVLAGELDRFTLEPRLPTRITLRPEAATRLAAEIILDIDEEGRVIQYLNGGGPEEIGKIEATQLPIPVFSALRLMQAAANNKWTTTRAEWTWKALEETPAPRVPGMSGVENGGLAPTTASAAPGLLDDIEPATLRAALEKMEGNITRAAVELGVTRDALRRRLAHHGIDPESFKPAGPHPLEDISEAQLRTALKNSKGNISAAAAMLSIDRRALQRRLEHRGIDPKGFAE